MTNSATEVAIYVVIEGKADIPFALQMSALTKADTAVTGSEHVEYEGAVCHHVVASARTRAAILRRASMQSDQSSAADSKLEVADEVDEAALASVMRTVPLGAAVLAGTMVALLVLGYLLIYTLVFIPRGTVG
jgi:hypothetical protein